MGGLPVNAKYVIHAKVEVDGIVDKSDIIGALFGQTEGIIGSDFDLRELQNAGRIGRIEINVSKSGRKVRGWLKIPSNLSKVETALIAAAIEQVDRVGPYSASVTVEEIEDVRVEKRRKVIERAKELLKKLEEEIPETKELIEEVLKELKISELTYYGPEKLPAGPEVESSDSLIIVEGRADVLNLLRYGYKNVIALGGAAIPKSIVDLASKKSEVTLFVDGDHGGELVAQNAISNFKVDYIARAPPGREVEELTGKEIARVLKNRITVEEFMAALKRQEAVPAEVAEAEAKGEAAQAVGAPAEVEIPAEVVKEAEALKGTLEAVLYGEDWKPVGRVPVRDLVKTISEGEGIAHVVFDGVITQRIVDAAQAKSIKTLVGARMGDVVRIPEGLSILTFENLPS